MYGVVQFYVQLKTELAPHRPGLKVLCIKLVIFFCFWQSWIISLLTTDTGPLKATEKVSGPDWRVGLPSMLVCFEMAIFAVLHIFAFPWAPYDLKRQVASHDGLDGSPKRYVYGPIRAFISSFNLWDVVKAFGRAMRWLFVGARHRKEDVSYQRKFSSDTGSGYQQGPTFAGNGEPATEMMKPRVDSKARHNGSDDSDTAGLLSHAQANPYGRQDTYQTHPHGANPYNPDSLPSAPTPGQEYGLVGSTQGSRFSFEAQDTSYHGYGDLGSGPIGPGPQRYELEDPGRPSTEWDMFAGATKPGTRPPGAPPGMI
jgi:hypothetical protein